MEIGAILFILAFAVIIIGPIAGLILGVIGRTKPGHSAPGRLEERTS